LNDSKVQVDNNKTNLNYFTPIIKSEKDRDIEKSQSDIDICPIPVAATLRRENSSSFCSSSKTSQEVSTNKQHNMTSLGRPQMVTTNTEVNNLDSGLQAHEIRHQRLSNYVMEPSQSIDRVHRKETIEFAHSLTSAMNVLEDNAVEYSRNTIENR